MEIKGKFFAVGHGLTYGFKVDSFHILFDIKNKKNLSNDLINFYGNKEIQALVISHFHDDHMNGIKKLYDDGFAIQRIYIPYIDDDEKFILRLKKSLKKDAKSKISPFLTKESDYSKFKNNNTEIIEVEGINSFTTSTNPFWEFNIHQSKGNSTAIVKKILSELAHIGIVNKEDVLSKVESHYKDIKDAYESAIKNLNLTSIFMVHGPINHSDFSESNSKGKEFLSLKINSRKIKCKYHSLISGDCNFLNNKKSLNSYIERLGYALVPHHSGVKEWSDFICIKNNDIQWIVTINRISQRPYGKIVRDIYGNKSELFICDQVNSFDYYFST